MSIKCALTGDNHFNVPKRSAEAQGILYWMLEDWKVRGVDFIGFGGDFADGPMTEKDRAWLIEFADACADVAPTVFIMGNHEIELALRCLRGRKTKYPIIVEEGAGVHVVETNAGKLAVAGVSFPYKAKLLAMVGSVSAEEADHAIGLALQNIFRGLGLQIAELGLPSVALVHGTIKGSKLGDDQPDRPLGLDIDVSDLTLMGTDFYCVPHIHAPNQFTWNDKTNIATPTSPFYADYGEAKHDKGYLWTEVEAGRDAVWRRISTPAVPMLLIEGAWQNDRLEITSKVFPHKDTVNGADVRLRFNYAKEHASAARSAAEELSTRILADGAVNVTLDPKLIPTVRTGIPGLATATRIEDKLRLYWDSIGNVPTPELATRLIDAFHKIQDELAAAGFSAGGTGRTAPALKKVRGKGLLKFPNEFEIDFRSLGALTTIIAPNEEGKTLLMQLMSAGVNYGKTPTRGSLDDLSTAKDSFIEVTQEMNGEEYVLSQMCNGMTRSGMVSLTKNGHPELSKAGRAEYKDWADANLIPQNLYDAVICQSGTESVIALKDGPRVELLLRVLGLEAYELLAEAARKRAKSISDQLGQVRARTEEIGDSVDLKALEQSVTDLQAQLDTANEQVLRATETLATKQEEALAVHTARIEYDSLATRRQGLETRQLALRSQITDLETRISNGREIISEATGIRAAVTEVKDYEATLTGLRTDESALKGRLDNASNELRSLQQQSSQLATTRASHERTLKEARATLADKDKIQQAVEYVSALERGLATMTANQDNLRQTLDEFQAGALTSADGRIVNLRGGLRHIVEGDENPKSYASTVLKSDDVYIAANEAFPAKLKALQASLALAVNAVNDATQSLTEMRRTADRIGSIETAERLEREALDAIDVLSNSEVEFTDGIGRTQAAIGEIEAEIIGVAKGIREAEFAIAERQSLAAKAENLSKAETLITERENQRTQVQTELDGVTLELDAIPPAGTPPEPVNVSSFEAAATVARNTANACQTQLVLAERVVTETTEKEARRQGLATQVKTLEATQSVWTRLGAELGKDGLQKAEITAAGPQLTEITNDLLRLAGDTRHTVSIETEKLHSDKKRMIPCLDIMVFDSTEGISKESRRLSDAGKIIVGWPFSLALITLGCERAGISGPTIFIDEATGPCDVENGPRCAAMLRHFAERLESQVVFIAQQPEIQALADSRIEIKDGQVTVR